MHKEYDHNKYPLTIYYDASCQLCKGEMQNLMLRNHDGLMVFVDCSPASFVSPIAGVDRTDMMNCIHAMRADGQVAKGVEVLRLAYQAAGLWWFMAPTRLPLVGKLADAAYPVLVRNRYRIPRWIVAALCEGPTRRAAEQAAAKRCDEQHFCNTRV